MLAETVVQKQTTRKFAGKNKHATQNGVPKSPENLMNKWLWRSCEISLSLCIGSKTLMSWGLAYLPVHQVTSVPQGLARRGEAARLRSPQWGGRPGLGPVLWEVMSGNIKVGFCWVYTRFMPPKWNKKVIEVGQCWVLTLSFVCALRALVVAMDV